jgi:hypothetical protein
VARVDRPESDGITKILVSLSAAMLYVLKFLILIFNFLKEFKIPSHLDQKLIISSNSWEAVCIEISFPNGISDEKIC